MAAHKPHNERIKRTPARPEAAELSPARRASGADLAMTPTADNTMRVRWHQCSPYRKEAVAHVGRLGARAAYAVGWRLSDADTLERLFSLTVAQYLNALRCYQHDGGNCLGDEGGAA